VHVPAQAGGIPPQVPPHELHAAMAHVSPIGIICAFASPGTPKGATIMTIAARKNMNADARRTWTVLI
jgi:hypothetical protein